MKNYLPKICQNMFYLISNNNQNIFVALLIKNYTSLLRTKMLHMTNQW